jgi:putative membrane protein
MMWWFGDGASGWGYGLVAVGYVVLLVLAVLGAVALLRGRGTSAAPRPTAEEVLAERFARGEIDEEEYRRRRDLLREWPRVERKG